MSLDAAGQGVSAPIDAIRSWSPATTMSITTWLGYLGPVLLVRDPAARIRGDCRRTCAIDSFGVREALHFGDSRVYRLADSDYFGWDHVASHCAESRPDHAGAGRFDERRAHLVRCRDRAWSPVVQLSALGWQQVREILKWEGARLEPLTIAQCGLER